MVDPLLTVRCHYETVHRPYRIPLGVLGCAVLLSIPTIATFAVMFLATAKTLIFSVIVNVVGMLVYHLRTASESWTCQSCCGYTRLDTSAQDLDTAVAEVDMAPTLT